MIEQITETTLLETKDNQNSNFKNFIDVGHFFSNHNEKIRTIKIEGIQTKNQFIKSIRFNVDLLPLPSNNEIYVSCSISITENKNRLTVNVYPSLFYSKNKEKPSYFLLEEYSNTTSEDKLIIKRNIAKVFNQLVSEDECLTSLFLDLNSENECLISSPRELRLNLQVKRGARKTFKSFLSVFFSHLTNIDSEHFMQFFHNIYYYDLFFKKSKTSKELLLLAEEPEHLRFLIPFFNEETSEIQKIIDIEGVSKKEKRDLLELNFSY